MTRALARGAAGLRRVETIAAAAAFLAIAAVPVAELFLRSVLRIGIPGASGWVQHLALWAGFLGAMLASREKRHLALATGEAGVIPASVRPFASAFSSFVSTAVAAALAWASFEFVRVERESPSTVGGWIPVWCAETILPVAFAVVAARFVVHAGGWRARAIAALGVPVAAAIGFGLEAHAGSLLLPGLAAILVAAVFGAPVFVVLGGAALLLFFFDGISVASIVVDTYRIVVSPTIPTIPLFTLAGFLLAEGGASRRLVRLFRALVGWMPGGLAVAVTLVCAFFTTFTGASGVTILSLGGLLLPVLVGSGYPDKFSIGLLTATGSIGLLFPPSLPVILYGVQAHVPIPDLFLAGLVPGILLVGAVAIRGMRAGVRAGAARPAFDLREAFAAILEAKWEIGLPVVALAGIFGGFCTLLEASALTVVYALLVECVVHRELSVFRDVPRVVGRCAVLVGGVFVILGVAFGLTNYLIDAEVPARGADWVSSHIRSPLVFLFVLNVFLLIVGCLMDIFSAIVVVVPLLLPIAERFSIDPLHLGIVFLANLELGYLTPPVGMNLFLASYRFERPLVEVARHAMPFLLVLLSVVLLITYVPALTTWAGTG
jgi:tripartite ATP-independent transporter DctM subunit